MSNIHLYLGKGNPAHYLSVLLAERLHILKAVLDLEDGISLVGAADIVKLVEDLVFWPREVEKRRFKEGSPTLGEVWEEVVGRYKEEGEAMPRAELCRLLGVGPSTLDQWIFRGRKRIEKGIGREEAERCIPHWFRR